MKNITSRPYFAGLDNLRAYAFGFVFFSHMYFNFFPANEIYRKIFAHGEVGVQIFFVLSAFLIMYLSLCEYSKVGSFSVLHFFKKRILRIWPVYFVVVGLSYMGYVASGMTSQMGCTYMFTYFFGNMCMIQDFPRVAGALTISPMWSVSVEQQFYTVFPIVFFLGILAIKKYTIIPKRIIHSVASVTALLVILFSIYTRYTHTDDWRYLDYSLISSLPSLVAGICLGYLMHMQSMVVGHVRKYYRTYVGVGVLAFLGSLFLKNVYPWGSLLYILPLVCSVLIYIILSTKEKTVTNITSRSSPVEYLGKISYGLYAYHMFAVVMVQRWLFPDYGTDPLLASVLTLFLTVCIAHVSYKYMESWFLKFK